VEITRRRKMIEIYEKVIRDRKFDLDAHIMQNRDIDDHHFHD
jgi:hypothetical protein